MMRWVSVLLILLVALVFEARAADYFLQSRTGTSGSLTTIKVPGGTGKVWVFDASGNLIPATIGSGLTLASGVLTAAGGGGGLSDGDKGDLTVSGSTWTIKNGVVTAAKLAGTLDLSGKTLTLPSDVTRLGNTIDLASGEVVGLLPATKLASTLNLTGKTITLPFQVTADPISGFLQLDDASGNAMVQLGNDGGGNGRIGLWDGANGEFRYFTIGDTEWNFDSQLNVGGLWSVGSVSAGGAVSSGGQVSARSGVLFDSLAGGDTLFQATTGHAGTRTVTWSAAGDANVTVPAGTFTLSGINVAETLGGNKSFTASSTQPGMRLGVMAGDPGSGLVDGSMWYNTSAHVGRLRVNGATRSLLHSGSSLADLATRSAGDLNSGTLPDGRFPATLPAASGVNLTALNASNLASGTVPGARLPLPGASTLGGVMSSTGTANQFATGINSSGQVTYGTPAGGLAPDGDGSMLTGITAGQVGAVAEGDAPTFGAVTLTDGVINSQTGVLAYNFYGVGDSTAVPYVAVSLYDDQDPPALIGSSLYGFRGNGAGSGYQIFQGSTNDFVFEAVGGVGYANVTANTFFGSFSGSGANLTNLDAGDISTGTLVAARGGASYATALQSLQGLSASTAISPATMWSAIHDSLFIADFSRFISTAVTGSGSIATTGGNPHCITGATANSTARGYWITQAKSGSSAWSTMDYSRPSSFGLTIMVGSSNATSTGILRVWFGTDTNASSIAARGYGFEVRHHRVWIIAHNGTTLSTQDTGVDIASTAFVLNVMRCVNDGAGNISMFMNNAQIGTALTGGPTTAGVGTLNILNLNGANAATNDIRTVAGTFTANVY